MSTPAHKPSEPAEVTDLSALFEFAEEATLDQDQVAEASPSSRVQPPVAAGAGQSRETRARHGHVDTGNAVVADRERRDEAQGKSNLEEILGGDLPLEALEPPHSDAHVADADTAFTPEESDELPAPVVARASVDRPDPAAQTVDGIGPSHEEGEPTTEPAAPELRLALEDSAIAEPSIPPLDLPEPDSTDEFESTAAESFESSEPEAPGPVETLTVADLLALGVELSWQEAVSVTLEWLQGWNDPDHCPDPSAAALCEGGRIELLSDGHVSGPAVPAAAMVLTDLLGSAKTPPQLRAMIENDREVPSEHADLAQFTSALSYFGRPNRRVDLAAVHTRLHESRRRLVAEHELSRLRARVVAVPKHRALPLWASAILDRAQENPLTFVLWLLVGMNSIAFLWLAMSSRAEAPPATVAAPGAPVAVASTPEAVVAELEPVQPAASATRGSRSEAAQPQTRTPPPASLPSAPAAPASRGNGPRAGAGTAAARSGGRGASSQGAASPAESSGSRPVNSAATATTPPAGGASLPQPRPAETAPVRIATPDRPSTTERPSTVERRPARRADDGRLYSSRDVDVIPPRLLRPAVRTPELVSSLGGEAAEFELVVGPTGRVERVRLLTPSERLEDKMLLAAAKAWEFDPAVRDGVPVWYRLTVRIP